MSRPLWSRSPDRTEAPGPSVGSHGARTPTVPGEGLPVAPSSRSPRSAHRDRGSSQLLLPWRLYLGRTQPRGPWSGRLTQDMQAHARIPPQRLSHRCTHARARIHPREAHAQTYMHVCTYSSPPHTQAHTQTYTRSNTHSCLLISPCAQIGCVIALCARSHEPAWGCCLS